MATISITIDPVKGKPLTVKDAMLVQVNHDTLPGYRVGATKLHAALRAQSALIEALDLLVGNIKAECETYEIQTGCRNDRFDVALAKAEAARNIARGEA